MKVKTSNSRRIITLSISEEWVEVEITYREREYEKENYFFERSEFDDIVNQLIESELLDKYL